MHPELGAHRRILLAGAPGVGKSTLARQLAAELAAEGRVCACVGCDSGSPAFGIPGAVSLGIWRDERWALVDFEPLCSLDAVRFRLPLVQAAARVLEGAAFDVLLVDAPGAVRGAAARELLTALAVATRSDAVVILDRAAAARPHEGDWPALGIAVYRLSATRAARAPSKQTRARQRTALWDAYLRDAEECEIDLEALACVGTPPPRESPSDWIGRQIALLHERDRAAMGEVTMLEGRTVQLRLRGRANGARALLVRDAQRSGDGLLHTAARVVEQASASAQRPAPRWPSAPVGPAPSARVGPFVATLVNGVFGDPLLLIRTRHARRSLIFDMGEATRLPARIAHSVTDVFISHAHIDHIAGFVSFLRSRIGDLPPVRVFGPPGIARNIAGIVAGVHWDRAGHGGPRFEVTELHADERLLRFTVSTETIGPCELGERTAERGGLVADPLFTVRAAVLDHGTPVLAFALESSVEINVRKERLAALGLAPGRWLGALKRGIVARDYDAPLALPSGGERTVGELASDLVMVRPGKKLAYATDLADTAANRQALADLARGAHTFFCEATFRAADAARAARTGHLTARACGEIATAAGVERLVPFHFSRRYANDPAAVYEEVRAACARTIVPRAPIGAGASALRAAYLD